MRGFRENTALFMASTPGNTEDVKTLLAPGAKVHTTTNAHSGTAPLHVASSIRKIMPSLPRNLFVIVRMLVVIIYSILHPSGMKVVMKAGANIQAKGK